MPTPKGHSTFGAPHGICWSSYTSLCPISLSFLPPLVEVQRAYLSKCPEAHLWLKISLVNATVIMQLIVQSKSILWLKVKVLAAQSCPTFWDLVDCNSPGSSDQRISQARILEWLAIFFSRASSRPRDETWISCIAGGFFTERAHWSDGMQAHQA